MLKGLYKVEMHTVRGSRRGVIYAYDGKMMGGNSHLAFIGTYREQAGGEVSADISTLRHSGDAECRPVFKTDQMTLAGSAANATTSRAAPRNCPALPSTR
jgi:hypothetical protein